MKRCILVILLAIGFSLPCHADDAKPHKPGGKAMAATKVTATVESIDYDTRHVTLKRDDGKTFTLKVGEVAHNFNQVKKGDKVTFDYMEAVAIDVRKAEGELSTKAEVEIERAPKGAKPKGMVAQTLTIKALVESIDYDTRHVTLKGPEGNSLTLKVGKQAKHFHDVKKGDHVVVQYTEALGISVTSPKG